MDAKGRRRTRHGAAHNRAKLTEYGVPTIHELTRQGLTQRDIAREFGVAQATVNQVLRGKTWKHVARTGAESEMGNGG
jgi:predicted XRE-type DNA-binding protein